MDPLFECCGQRCSTIGLLGTVSGMISVKQLDAEGWGGRNYWLAILVKPRNDRNRTDNRNPGDDSVFHPSQPFKFVNALTSQVGTELLAIPLAKKRSPSVDLVHE